MSANEHHQRPVQAQQQQQVVQRNVQEFKGSNVSFVLNGAAMFYSSYQA